MERGGGGSQTHHQPRLVFFSFFSPLVKCEADQFFLPPPAHLSSPIHPLIHFSLNSPSVNHGEMIVCMYLSSTSISISVVLLKLRSTIVLGRLFAFLFLFLLMCHFIIC